MHDSNNTNDSCARRRRLPAWLHLAASDLRTALSWRWLVYLGACLMRLRLCHIGTTSIMVPTITGGIDHSLAAHLGRPCPMAFRGGRHRGDTCDVGTMPVDMTPRSIYSTRLGRIFRARAMSFGFQWCTSLSATVDRVRTSGGAA